MSVFNKYVMVATLVLNSTLIHAQVDNVTWITTPFWTAPQVKELNPSVVAFNMNDLNKSCIEYKRRIETLTLPGEEELVARYRTSDAFSNDGTFKAKFKISPLEETYQLTNSFVVDHSTERLPFYTQTEALTFAYIDDKAFYLIQDSPGSYTTLSRSLKLEDSEFTVEYEAGNLVLTIFGKDVACDLVAGKTAFEITTSASVKINDGKYEEMKQFYLNKIQPDLSVITWVGSKDSQIIKSARLGFRFGNHIKNQTSDDSKVVEKQLENLMNILFVPGTLKNSSSVLDSVDGKKKEIQLPSTAEGKPVKIYLKYLK
jgi:hypothetical protein